MAYLIEVPAAPDSVHRYLIYPGGIYSGPSSTQFVDLKGACKTDGRGGWTGRANFDVAQRVVDEFRALVEQGHPDTWLGSIRVTTYAQNPGSREVVYPRPLEVEAVEPELPAVMQASDGAWRVVPTANWKKTPRGWGWSFGFVDSDGIPRAETISGSTRLAIMQRVFEKGFAVFEELVKMTFPLAQPSQIPAAPAVVVDRVYSPAELAAVEAFPEAEYIRMPVAEYSRRRATDPVFAARIEKLFANMAARQKLADEARVRQQEQDELAQRRKQFASVDADEARKTGR